MGNHNVLLVLGERVIDLWLDAGEKLCGLTHCIRGEGFHLFQVSQDKGGSGKQPDGENGPGEGQTARTGPDHPRLHRQRETLAAQKGFQSPGIPARLFAGIEIHCVPMPGTLLTQPGLATFLSLRPKSSLQRLFVLFFFLTALWIVAGNSSRRNLWEASVVFRMAIWLCVPVYLHLHWSFPRSLRPATLAKWRR